MRVEQLYRLKKWKSIFVYVFSFVLNILFCSAQHHPRTHIAYQTIDSIDIDGSAEELSWQKAPWSNSYIDIEGSETPKYQTRMKILWDEKYMYLFAVLEEPHVWGTLKERDTIIFYNNDFEIFIDPDGDTHNYYEFEMNALNTVWDLFLSKPYRNGGAILGAWDFKGLKSAVGVRGTLNNPDDIDEGWQVEIAIPWSFKTPPDGRTTIPKDQFWRMNFSRVNWRFDLKNRKYSRAKDINTKSYLPEYNWVWSPQGVINMHEPEHWGYVYFSEKYVGEKDNFKIPDDEHIKWFLYEEYRKLLDSQPNENTKVTSREIQGKPIHPELDIHHFGWTIWVRSPFTSRILSISKDGKFQARAEEE